jgi:hypothetical protein
MNDEAINLTIMLPEKYIPNWEKLKKTKAENPFEEAAFGLLKEAGIYATLTSAIIPKASYKRDNAILCALVVKLAKLTKAMIAMTLHLGGDRQLAMARELIEALSILDYLLNDADGSRFEQYVLNSLVIEKEFVKTINTNVIKRNKKLKIEESMLRSVQKAAKAAGYENISKLPSRKKINWPNVETLIAQLDKDLYLSYRSGSGIIHTQWDDLLRHHLIPRGDDTFEPRYEERLTRPQPLYGAALLLVRELKKYIKKMRPKAEDKLFPLLDDLLGRTVKVAGMHSVYLDNL